MPAPASELDITTIPKVELHIHLQGTITVVVVRVGADLSQPRERRVQPPSEKRHENEDTQRASVGGRHALCLFRQGISRNALAFVYVQPTSTGALMATHRTEESNAC